MRYDYGQIMPLVTIAFKTEERRSINRLTNEFRVVMKFDKVLGICSVTTLWLLVTST